ncbi:MAG: substrate-binding domain-containing protein, partial [Longilinea sp.]|nr:substrate-binding domain-containing protein [Longilinea sp.]
MGCVKRYWLGWLGWGLLLLLLVSCRSAAQQQEEAAFYLQNKGSDTMVNLALAWAERYQQENPQVRISVTGGGSGTGIAALMNGTVDLANA